MKDFFFSSLYRLFYVHIYIAVFYIISAATFVFAGAYLRRLGVSAWMILLGGVLLLLPLHLAVYALWRFLSISIPRLARCVISMTLRLESFKSGVLSVGTQRRIVIGATHFALVATLLAVGTASSLTASYLITRISDQQSFVFGSYLLIFLFELVSMGVLVFIPYFGLRRWIPSAIQRALKDYDCRAGRQGYDYLKRTAKIQGLRLDSSTKVPKDREFADLVGITG
jgi:hypothetical protein